MDMETFKMNVLNKKVFNIVTYSTLEDEEDESGVIMAKVIAMLTLFGVSTIFGIIPFKLVKVLKLGELGPDGKPKTDARTSKAVSVLLSFGGGVLLATTFLHLLPEIALGITVLQGYGRLPMSVDDFHLPELLMCVGFFVIYLIEELVHSYLHRHKHNLEKNKKLLQGKEPMFGEAVIRGKDARNSSICSEEYRRKNSLENEMPKLAPNARAIHETQHVESNNHSHEHSHLPLPHSEEEDFLVASLRGLLIVLALSIHELFEGLAVGLESSTGKVWFMFGAVAAHKFIISFCIGVELMVQRTKIWLAFVYVFTFSVVSAIGIGIGILISSGPYAESMEVASVVLQGLATGTLLYVIFFEILSKDRSGIFQYLSVLIGFSFMAGLQFIVFQILGY